MIHPVICDANHYLGPARPPAAPASNLHCSRGTPINLRTLLVRQIYKTTNHRVECYQESKKIDQFLRQAFLRFDYNIIEIPKLNISKRADFIINNI